MSFRRIAMLLAACCLTLASSSGAQTAAQPAPDYAAALEQIVSLQQQVTDLHPAFAKAYPVAVVVNKTFYVYEQDAASRRYRLVKTAPDTMNVTFYFGGEALIRALSTREPGIEKDLERLYPAIAGR